VVIADPGGVAPIYPGQILVRKVQGSLKISSSQPAQSLRAASLPRDHLERVGRPCQALEILGQPQEMTMNTMTPSSALAVLLLPRSSALLPRASALFPPLMPAPSLLA